jgi:predicted MPP superfamily phosphohydrolase
VKKKIFIAILIAFILGITAANAANNPIAILTEKTLWNKYGIYKICDNHNLLYFSLSKGGQPLAMTVVAKGC